MTDTIFALSSGRPPAAVSVIRISGPRAHEAAERLAGDLPAVRMAQLRALREPVSGSLLDQALVLRFDSPASATGEDTVEFHCHGGRAVVEAILAALAQGQGVRRAEPGEFTRRAFANGRMDLTEAEALADLIEAETESQRKAALRAAQGGLRKRIAQWQDRLVVLSAQAERAIDYDDEDEAADPSIAGGCRALAEELGDWLERPRTELLKDGVLVVVAGPPNSGKSSLINAIAGEEKAIVTDVPGTTRDQIEVPLALCGVPIRLVDTAGLRRTEDRVEAIGVARAEQLVARADVLVWLGPPDEAPGHAHLVRVHSKADLPARQEVPAASLPVSSTTHAGIAGLLATIEQIARTLLPGEDELSLNQRQASCIAEGAAALLRAAAVRDQLLVAEELRAARAAFDRLTGRAGVEDVLDALFGRFCLGK